MVELNLALIPFNTLSTMIILKFETWRALEKLKIKSLVPTVR